LSSSPEDKYNIIQNFTMHSGVYTRDVTSFPPKNNTFLSVLVFNQGQNRKGEARKDDS